MSAASPTGCLISLARRKTQSRTDRTPGTPHFGLAGHPFGGIRLNGLGARCLQLHREAGADEQCGQWPQVVQRGLATRNHDMPCAERLHGEQDVLRRHHGPGVLVCSVLTIISAIDTRRSGSANQLCLVSDHGHLTGHACNRTNTDSVPALQASPWIVWNIFNR